MGVTSPADTLNFWTAEEIQWTKDISTECPTFPGSEVIVRVGGIVTDGKRWGVVPSLGHLWLKDGRGKYRQGTWSGYAGWVNWFGEKNGNPERLIDLTPSDVVTMLAALKEHP